MAALVAQAHARVGLLGNPSDLYGGRALGFAVRELAARVALEPSAAVEIENELLAAGWREFERELAKRGRAGAERPFRLDATCDIPYQAGLSGSSALLIASLRAWCEWYELPLSRSRVAELAWRIENDLLGIRAGPLDRLVQAHEGLLALDFREPWSEGAVERLDRTLLPPLLLAWHGAPGQRSGDVHAPVFERFRRGDRDVVEVTAALAANADSGRRALESRDVPGFLACVDRNLELRSRLFELAPVDVELAALGRSFGAAAKLPGSGGSVLFACADEAQLERVESACRARGVATLRPTVAPPVPRVRTVFLAAGFATRLYPLTLRCAKPLLEVGGVPMLTRLVRQVEAAVSGDGVVVTNGRFHRDFVEWARVTPTRITIGLVDDGALDNESRLGAIADLALALRSAPAREDVDAYLVLACDNLLELDFAQLVARFAERGRGQLVVRTVPEPVPPAKYSEVTLAGDHVASFREKPADPRSNLSAIAVYLLPRDLPERVHQYLSTGGNPDAPGHFIAWLAERTPLEALRFDGRWLDIGTREDLERAARTFEGAARK